MFEFPGDAYLFAVFVVGIIVVFVKSFSAISEFVLSIFPNSCIILLSAFSIAPIFTELEFTDELSVFIAVVPITDDRLFFNSSDIFCLVFNALLVKFNPVVFAIDTDEFLAVLFYILGAITETPLAPAASLYLS